MNLAISNIAWKPKNRKKIYKFLSKEKISGIEIAPKLLLHNVKDIFKLNKKKINNHFKELQKYNLQLVSMQSLLYGANDCYLFYSKQQRANFIQHLSKVIVLAKKLKIPNLVFGSPKNRMIPSNMKYKDAEKIAIITFRKIGKIAKQNNIYFAIESNPKEYGTNFLNNIHQTYNLVKKIKSSNIKINLDTGEILMNSETQNIEKIIKKCIKFINHVHISKPYLKPINNKKFFLKLINILKKYNYTKWVSIEMRNQDKNNFENVKKAIRLLKKSF